MTQISRDDILHLAKLSRLALSDDELDALMTDIPNILRYVEQLNELDTENVKPSYQVTGLSNVWREDKVLDSGVSREELLALASSAANDQVKVPKVL